ncbi:MAG: class I SAM-dependent methyltransferase [Armatimonadota bacterium]
MRKSRDNNPFDENAEHYDAWFDTSRGRAIFESEVQCLRLQMIDAFRPWLEVGVGTGRFAKTLGIECGIDPSPAMLEMAAKRGINVQQGVGEKLPYEDGSFGGVMIVVSLCFVSEPECVLREAARVLRSDGRLVLGIIPANSSWGEMYAAMAQEGHPIYSKASFFSVAEAVEMAKAAGFEKSGAYSTLLTGPDSEITEPLVWAGTLPSAGFVATSFSLKHSTGRNAP